MKYLTHKILLLLLLFGYTVLSHAQQPQDLVKGKIVPYPLEVTFDKTSHLIFPSAIRYVDLGSEYLIADKAEDAGNVLRVKAAVRDFTAETNFSVITDDGTFYNFNVCYHPAPEVLNINMAKLGKTQNQKENNEARFSELGSDPPSLTGLLLETIYQRNERAIKHIGSKRFGILFTLKGLFVHNGKFYFHTEIKNSTNLPFDIDFITFKVVDKKVAKRTVVQESQVSPLRMYRSLGKIEGKTTDRNVFLLNQLTIANDKVLLVQVFEKNGSRHQGLKIEHSDLIRAHTMKDMQVKF